jgi:hypothetical protein
MTLGDKASRLTMARMWSMPCIRATVISVSSSIEGEEVRKGAAMAIGWQPMNSATACGIWPHCDKAATACRLASSEEAENSGVNNSANWRSSDRVGGCNPSKLLTVAIRTTSVFRLAEGASRSRNRSRTKTHPEKARGMPLARTRFEDAATTYGI